MINKEKAAVVCDRMVEICILAILFFVPVYFAFFQENYNIFELDKLLVFRALLLLGWLVMLAKIFIRGKITYRFDRKIIFFTALLAAAYFLSSLVSLHPQMSFWGSYMRQQGFYSLVSYLAFFLLLLLQLRDWRQVRRIIITAVFASAPACLYGLLQFFNLDPYDWQESALYTGRIFSSLGQPNFLGQYLVMIVPLTIYSIIYVFKKPIARLLLLILLVSQLANILLTYSRAAWLALVFSGFVFLLLFLLLKNRKKTAIGLFVLSLFGLSALMILNNTLPLDSQSSGLKFLVYRARSTFAFDQESKNIRVEYWRSGIDELRQVGAKRLIFGAGTETLSDIFAKYYNPEWGVYEKINSFPDRAHNSFFDTVLQFGLLGLIALWALYGYIIFKIIKFLFKVRLAPDGGINDRYLALFVVASLTAYFTSNLFGFPVTTNYVYLYCLLALAIFLLSRNTAEKDLNLAWLSVGARGLIFISAGLIFILFFYTQDILPFIADTHYMKAKKAEAASDCMTTLEEMAAATKTSPGDNFYKYRYAYHGLNCFSTLITKGSREDLYYNISNELDAIPAEEQDFYVRQTIAHAYALFAYYIDKKYYPRAEVAFVELIKMSPYFTSTYQDFGRMYLRQKNYKAAIEQLDKGLAACPSLNDPYLAGLHKQEVGLVRAGFYDLLGDAYNGEKNLPDALKAYMSAQRLNPSYLPIYKKIADIYYLQSDLKNAIKYNRHGYLLNPHDYNWPLALAVLYREEGDLAEAKRYAREAAAINPEADIIKKLLNELGDIKKSK